MLGTLIAPCVERSRFNRNLSFPVSLLRRGEGQPHFRLGDDAARQRAAALRKLIEATGGRRALQVLVKVIGACGSF